MTLIPFDDPISPHEIGEHLCRMMEATGITSVALAARCNVSPAAIERWRAGQRLEKVATILAAFEAMGCTVKILPPKR